MENKRRYRIAIVTDYYHPYEQGGAEMSLRYLLNSLSDQFEFEVFCIRTKFSDIKNIDGIKVNYLPCVSTWEKESFNAYSHKKSHGVSKFIIQYLLGQDFSGNTSQKVSLLVHNWLSHFQKWKFESFDENLIQLSKKIGALNSLLSQKQFDLIHYDNLYSILLAGKIPHDKSLGFIRDLRFLCSNKEQLAHTSKEVCTSCRFQCLEEKSPIRALFLKKIMSKNQEFRRKALTHLSHIVVASEFMKESVSSLIENPRISVLPNPIIHSEGEVDFAMKEQNLIVYAGSSSKHKGLPYLIDEFSSLSGDLQSLMLNVYSDYTNVDNSITNISFHPWLKTEDLHKELSVASIVVCPSLSPEPFGRMAIEGMSKGCIVLASKYGAHAQYIIHAKNGFLFDPFKKDNLKKVLREIHDHDNLRDIRLSAIDTSKKFNLTHMGSNLEQLYISIIEQ